MNRPFPRAVHFYLCLTAAAAGVKSFMELGYQHRRALCTGLS